MINRRIQSGRCCLWSSLVDWSKLLKLHFHEYLLKYIFSQIFSQIYQLGDIMMILGTQPMTMAKYLITKICVGTASDAPRLEMRH